MRDLNMWTCVVAMVAFGTVSLALAEDAKEKGHEHQAVVLEKVPKAASVGLLDSNGEFYVLLDPKAGEPQREAARRMGQTVSVTGLIVEEPEVTSSLYVR